LKQKITKSVVDALLTGQAVSDVLLEGFRVRAGKSSKTYSVQKRVGIKIVTRTIGRHGLYTPDQARERAKRILLELSQGVDPLEAKRRLKEKQEVTFGRLFDLYLEKPNLKDSTKREIRSKVGKHLADWLKTPATEITRQMVLDRHRQLVAVGPTQAALIARYARAIFNFGIDYYTSDQTGESIIPRNPVDVILRRMEMPAPRRRETVLDRSRIRSWFRAWHEVRTEHSTACDYILMTVLLGSRRSEAMHLRWTEVSLDERTVRFVGTKNGMDHLMPIGEYLFSVLKERFDERAPGEDFVFPGRSKIGHLTEPRRAMGKITELSGVKFIVSDLRRTFATHAKELGIEYFDVQRLLNHRVRANEATPGYIIMAIERRRELVQRVEDYLLKLGGLKETPVIPLTTFATEKAA
jgi:integrase